MDLKLLQHSADHLTNVEKSKRLLTKGRKSALYRSAGELSVRYRQAGEGFRNILDILGYDVEAGASLRTPDILLGGYHGELGDGTLSANVRMDLHGLSAHTYFNLATAQHDRIPITEEWFTSAGTVLRNMEHFADDSTGHWIDNNEFRDSFHLYGPYNYVDCAWRDVGPKIEAAEATQAMLWQAVGNRALNPDLAYRASVLQRA